MKKLNSIADLKAAVKEYKPILDLRENPDPTDEEVLEYLSGNLCRCTGYQSQLRSIRNFLNSKKEGAPLNLEAGVYGEDIGKEWQDEHKSN